MKAINVMKGQNGIVPVYGIALEWAGGSVVMTERRNSRTQQASLQNS